MAHGMVPFPPLTGAEGMGSGRTVYAAARNNTGRYRPKAQRADSAAIPAPAGTEVHVPLP